MARKRQQPKARRTESVASKARRLGIVLPTGEEHVASKSERQVARKGQRNRTVGVAVSTEGASLSGRGRITRFVVADGDSYAVRLKGRTVASGFATPGEAARYADALGNRRFRRLADPKLRLPQEQPSPTESALRDAGHDRATVAELLLLANSGAVRVTVR